MYPLDSENQSFTIAAVLTFVRRFVSFLGDRLHKSSAVAEMGDRLDTIDIGRKCWGSALFLWGGELGPPGQRPTSVPRGNLIHHPFSHNRHGPKIGEAVPLAFGGAGSSSNTMSPEPRPTSVPGSILIHPAVWPQQT